MRSVDVVAPSLRPANPILYVVILMLVTALPQAHAAEPTTVPDTDDCAVPCGKIYADLRFELPLDARIGTTTIDVLPPEVPVTIYYEWDFEQDATGVPGDAEEMEILLQVTRSPTWLTATFADEPCTFFLNPAESSHKACTIPLYLEVDPSLLPATEEAHETAGKNLWLFASSPESGSFMASFGMEPIRFDWDGAPESAPAAVQTTAQMPAPAALPVVGLLLTGLGAARRRFGLL